MGKMMPIVKDIRQSPFESVVWLLSGVGLAGIGIWIYNKYFGGEESLENWKTHSQKELGIDLLKINKVLCFGTQARQCPAHDQGDSLCMDVDCSFGPLGHLLGTINMAKSTIDMAIFSISSNIIGEAILEAHKRGVMVRVVADADSAYRAGSVLPSFREARIQVRQRISPFHMHHKFIVLDGEILINGSMNFSDTGAIGNWENVVITSEPGLVLPFVREFQNLWKDFEQGRELTFKPIPTHARKIPAL